MTDTGYTIVKEGHDCPKPPTGGLIRGTIIQCNDCGRYWEWTLFFGWLRLSPDDARLKGDK